MCRTVLEDLGRDVINIEKFYEQRNQLHPRQVVLDTRDQVSSFEIAMVVCVGRYSYTYIESSRARAKLINITLNCDSSGIEDLKKNYPNARFTITDPAKYQSSNQVNEDSCTIT